MRKIWVITAVLAVLLISGWALAEEAAQPQRTKWLVGGDVVKAKPVESVYTDTWLTDRGFTREFYNAALRELKWYERDNQFYYTGEPGAKIVVGSTIRPWISKPRKGSAVPGISKPSDIKLILEVMKKKLENNSRQE